jgi:hypothetical protein
MAGALPAPPILIISLCLNDLEKISQSGIRGMRATAPIWPLKGLANLEAKIRKPSLQCVSGHLLQAQSLAHFRLYLTIN